MAPEVRTGAAYGPESDLYSLGVMMKRDLERIFGPEVSLVKPITIAYVRRVLTFSKFQGKFRFFVASIARGIACDLAYFAQLYGSPLVCFKNGKVQILFFLGRLQRSLVVNFNLHGLFAIVHPTWISRLLRTLFEQWSSMTKQRKRSRISGHAQIVLHSDVLSRR